MSGLATMLSTIVRELDEPGRGFNIEDAQIGPYDLAAQPLSAMRPIIA